MTVPSDRLPRTAEAAPPPPSVAAEPRQRWRLTFARELPARDEVPTGREYVGRWEEALIAAGLPVVCVAVRPSEDRARCSAAVGLLGGRRGPRVLADARSGRHGRFARASSPSLPDGHRAVGLESVWLGAAALSGQIAAADYEVTVRASGNGHADVDEAARRLHGS